MCRNIKTLHNFKPPATDEEIRASAQRIHAALQSERAGVRPRGGSGRRSRA